MGRIIYKEEVWHTIEGKEMHKCTKTTKELWSICSLWQSFDLNELLPHQDAVGGDAQQHVPIDEF